MRVGFIDLDNINRKKVFPNIPIMKLSAYHKSLGDDVGWYDGTHCDKVYVSKVFSFTPDYKGVINANEVEYGGSGYAIEIIDGREVYDKANDKPLPKCVENMFPDYSIYGISDTAYGFLQRGCPRQCHFCHVKSMQGIVATKVANLSDFWNGQKNIVLLDPNITACKDWKELFQQLIDSKAYIDFSQGIDARTLNEEKISMLKQMKIKRIHCAWDRYEDGKYVVPQLKKLKELTGWSRNKVMVYVLTNFNTTIEQDIERVQTIREIGFQPYVMRYDKEHIPRGSEANALARWVNFIPLFQKYKTFEEYKRDHRKGKQ